MVRRLGSRYGDIHIRFGEPLSLQKALGPPDPAAEPNADEESLALQKLAFEVCVRINQVTPITPISLVTLALLGRGDRAQSLRGGLRVAAQPGRATCGAGAADHRRAVLETPRACAARSTPWSRAAW